MGARVYSVKNLKSRYFQAGIIIFFITIIALYLYTPPVEEPLEKANESEVYDGSLLFPRRNMSLACRDCNLVFISIDTLRADHVGFMGYGRDTTPNIDGWSEKSMVFTNMYNTMPETMPSLASKFTSRPPYLHGLQYNGQKLPLDEVTLAEILSENGYVTRGIAGWWHINNRSGIQQGFKDYAWGDMPAGELTNRSINWIGNHMEKKFFIWIHYWDPHKPHTPPAKYDFTRDDMDNKTRMKTLYDGEILYTDHEISRLLDFIRNSGLLEKTLIVLTSDHGEAFGEHDYWNHGDVLYEEQLHLLMMIYNRGIRYRSGRLSQNTMIMPTVLDLLEIKHDIKVPGLHEDYEMEKIIFEGDKCRNLAENIFFCHPRDSIKGKKIGVRRGGLKYIYTPVEDGYLEELYNLETDPAEIHNLITGGVYLKQLSQLRKDVEGVKPLIYDEENKGKEVDEETMQVLRALGYVQ